ncbi:hypothetical protein PHLCEN_2v4572 [Hermanssonia centrifuga]|uniref:Uncharacterized protein n=1 Tax=Hermanssonia centrifuga TaxID=98765 RepID=A0A2R6PN63_9APHY|nr:hypothetical protein PHLCEN_2v4572 [Hermanssonia centrifuga]
MLAQSTSAQATEKSVIAGFNTKLAARAAALETNNTGVATWVWDSNTAFTTVLNNPTAYGFVDSVSYGNTGDFWGCCSTNLGSTGWGIACQHCVVKGRIWGNNSFLGWFISEL